MMASFPLGLLFAHWLALLDAIHQIFWSYTPRPLLSTVFPGLIEDGSEFSPIIRVSPQIHDPPGYINSIDVTTICLVPTTLPTPSTINVTCSIDRPGYDLDDVPLIMAEPSHYYVFLDTPVWRPAQLPHEDAPPTLLLAQAEDDDARINMASYGTRGLSFCPVLVGIAYIHSLLHLYMLLMDEIPSFFNHWFEDALVYDSLNPKDLLDFSWFFHTSFWIVPWNLFRYGTRKTIACLCRHRGSVTRKLAHPPIPRIVLIRIDGEAVPVKFAEDFQANVDIGVWLPLESVSWEVDHRAAAIEGGEAQDSVLYTVPCSDGGIAEEFESSSVPAVSPQSECQDGLARAQDGIGLELFTSEFGEGSRTLINEVSDQRAKCSPAFVDAENEPPQSTEEIILTRPVSDTFVVTTSDSGEAEEKPGDFQHTAFLDVANNDIYQDTTDSPGDGKDQDQDPTLSPWIIVDDRDPYRSDAPDTVMTASLSTGSHDTPLKNVRFDVHDDTNPADDRQVSLGASCADEHPARPRALESQLCDDGDDSPRTEQVPVDPFDTSMEPTPFDQVTQPVLSAVLSEEAVEDIDMLTQGPTPPSPEQPVVNLPSLIAMREDVRFIEIDHMLPSALMEDVVTRSPLQIHCPIMPAVVINMACDIKEMEERLAPSGTKELNQDTFGQTETPNGMAAARGMLNIDSREHSSFPPSPFIEGLHSVYSSTVNIEQSIGDIWTPGALSASPTGCRMDMPIEVTAIPETNGLGAKISYESPRYPSNVKDRTGSPQTEVQGPEVSVPDTMGLPAVLEPRTGHGTEDQAKKSDGMTIITLSGQTVGFSCAEATELLTTKPSEEVLVLLCNEASPLPTIPGVKKTEELDDSESNTIPRDHLKLILKPPPERTLSGSMHAPSESLPDLQPNKHIDQTPILYETSLSSTCSVQAAKVDDNEAVTNVIAENRSEREHGLFVSIHAPIKVSKVEVRSSVSQSRDENHCDHRRSVTTPVIESEKKPKTKPCAPNWAAMPDVVDAFRVFREAPSSGNSLRRVSSIAECTNRAPTVGVIGQKGIATNSLNNTCVIANIQSRWMNESGLLLVRDLVPSDPADFNLRTCTNLRVLRSHGMNAMPMQQVLHPGVLDVSPYAFQRQQSMLVPCVAELEHILGSQRWTAYRR